MKTRVVIIIAGLGLAAVGAVFAVTAVRRAQQAPQAIADGFGGLVAEQQAQNDDLRAKNVDLDRQIIEDWREGYGKPSKADLPQYVADLTWAKTRLRPTDPEQRELDRDIAWCNRRMK
jgi:cell division protein FtsB